MTRSTEKMIAERASEPASEGGEVGGVGADHIVDVNAWLEQRPNPMRAFVENYRPRHRADPLAG